MNAVMRDLGPIFIWGLLPEIQRIFQCWDGVFRPSFLKNKNNPSLISTKLFLRVCSELDAEKTEGLCP